MSADPYLSEKLRAARDLRYKFLSLDSMRLTEVPDEIFELKDLEELSLSGNQLPTIPAQLRDLPNLRRIWLYGNPIESLPDIPGVGIDGSTYLRCRAELPVKNIAYLRIGADTPQDNKWFWADELRNLTELRGLVIGKWSFSPAEEHPEPGPAIRSVFDSLAGLTFLESLSLLGWKLPEVPAGIRKLCRLKSLNLAGLGLQNLPDWIGELNIANFDAWNNNFAVVPDALRNLRGLKSLSLGLSPIERLPEWLFDMEGLEGLDFYGCPVRQIPAGILRLPNLSILRLSEVNDVESPPQEVVKEGLDAIRNYWRQRATSGVDYLCEAKLIILGEGGAGKTSLARKLENPAYKLREREPSTEGIDVIRWRFPTAIRVKENVETKILERSFQVNIWDFGGQEIYHATHQFFLTKRSVYILVCDDRKEDTDFNYWLQAVEMASDASPLIVVQNEKQDRTRDINLSSLRARFPNLRGAVATNLDTNRGLNDVVQAIRKELESLPHVGVGLPATWKQVREALERDPREYIGLHEYLDICGRHGFTRREDKLQLSGYLHDLGICLHFQDDPLLKNTVILKPKWGTDAVYRVLDDAEVVAARGQFTREHLNRIWSEPKYAGMQDELLQLMMKFQLCYGLEDELAYIAPQLLSSEQPPYPWSDGGLAVRYEYGFLPKGIVTRFIVAMHRLIAAEGKLVWKTGVVLERGGTRAEVIEESAQRRIRVRVSGPDPRGMLAIVDDHLERLHRSFPRLQYERYLPCPCAECEGKPEPYAFPLDKLQKMAAKGQSIQCYASGEMVDAGRLIRDVLPGAFAREQGLFQGFVQAVAVSATAAPAPPSQPSREVFVSYAWTDASTALVDRIEEALGKHGIRLLRDREEMRYKDSIRDFMRRIGQGKCVVVVISEKYLKSENCMFEMLEIAQAGALRERIFPVVLPDANIYKATGRVRYVRYWEDEIRELDEALKTVRGDSLAKLQEDLTLYAEIRRSFDRITDMLRDMNALSPEQHEGSGFDELIRRIRAQAGA